MKLHTHLLVSQYDDENLDNIPFNSYTVDGTLNEVLYKMLYTAVLASLMSEKDGKEVSQNEIKVALQNISHYILNQNEN